MIIDLISIKTVLNTFNQLRLYSSSLLIIYEGLTSQTWPNTPQKHYLKTGITESVDSICKFPDTKPFMKVKIIDFANVALPEDDAEHHGPDHGFLLGLQSLQGILENLLLVEDKHQQ